MIYEFIVRVNFSSSNTCKKGYIWCTDGTFIHPSRFKRSNKLVFGYCLNNNIVVSIKRSSFKFVWGSSDLYQGRLTRSESRNDGESNGRSLRFTYGISPFDCPAIYVCLSYSNSGVKSYMPAIDELRNLYNSIMSGKMKEDLITAGIYERCNYRNSSNYTDNSIDKTKTGGWGQVWSSSQVPSDSECNLAFSLDYNGSVRKSNKTEDGYVIPFFKFNKTIKT